MSVIAGGKIIQHANIRIPRVDIIIERLSHFLLLLLRML